MRKPNRGTEPRADFAIEHGASWQRWAKRRTDGELDQIAARLTELRQMFGRPHQHAGLGVRRLAPGIFELRISRDLRVVFVFIKPRTFRLAMVGNHDEVRAWLKENV